MKKYFVITALPVLLALVLSGCIKFTAVKSQPDTTAAEETVMTTFVHESTVPATEYVAPFDTPTAAPEYTPSVTSAPPNSADADLSAMNKEELLTYFNNAVNKIKLSRLGFTRTVTYSAKDISFSNPLADSFAGVIKSALVPSSGSVTSVTAGNPCDALVSPSNVPYVSALFPEDVDDCSAVPQNGGYVITVRVKGENNPSAAGSISSRIFDVLTPQAFASAYAPQIGADVSAANTAISVSGSYARAVLDAEGNVTEYETCVENNVKITGAKFRVMTSDISVVLEERTVYSDIRYSNGIEF